MSDEPQLDWLQRMGICQCAYWAGLVTGPHPMGGEGPSELRLSLSAELFSLPSMPLSQLPP